ncbi:DNA double-strand break repair protein Rad50 [Paulownia witches'-broom phytoplasma]|uniref:DNA double-strand break repair protein Rad50 n=1 Tax=Paulownia witches'-broom phytoplasma TaxID=39647 RepID=UPI001CECAA01|nr:DNA double-strand break repair protein Rad50 [Paulownia witches'-broom phytoplasma]GLH60869.1 hypothetical protein PAWBP_6070 [Paulownia witches'-broom phytoplasma]
MKKKIPFHSGNAFKFGFKAFDKITDLIPAKFGIKTLGKTISVTRKYAQGMGKATLILHEGHRLWHMYNEVANENKESPLMITKETLDIYLNNIDRDLTKLNADYKEYKKKKEEYILEQNDSHLKNEIDKENQQEEKIIERKRIVIYEYQKIVFELDEKIKQIADIPHLKENEYDFNLQLEKVKEEKKLVEEEFYKESNPNYNRVQKRIQQKRQTKIPEMVMMPNK